MRLFLAAVMLLTSPAAAQVKIDDEADTLAYLTPNFLPLTDGSQLAIMATNDLKTTTVLRCWPHAETALCFKSSESLVIDGIPAISFEWYQDDDWRGVTMPFARNDACARVLTETRDNGDLPNCQRLLDILEQSGPLALARLPITQIAPQLENLPSSLLRQSP